LTPWTTVGTSPASTGAERMTYLHRPRHAASSPLARCTRLCTAGQCPRPGRARHFRRREVVDDDQIECAVLGERAPSRRDGSAAPTMRLGKYPRRLPSCRPMSSTRCSRNLARATRCRRALLAPLTPLASASPSSRRRPAAS
jgi:hypothetical protein